MCVAWTGGWIKAQEDIIAYKVCEEYPFAVGNNGEIERTFTSQYAPHRRAVQTKDGENQHRGVNARYDIGETMKDDEYFGFYLYQNEGAAIWESYESAYYHVLEVRIPKGTMIRHGLSYQRDVLTINAREIEVLRKIN